MHSWPSWMPASRDSTSWQYYEPIWAFHRDELTLTQLSDLNGLRTALGPEGSGTRAIVTTLLTAGGIQLSDLVLSELHGFAALDALRNDELDVRYVVAGPEAEIVRRALADPSVRFMHFIRGEAYVRRYPFLSMVTLPEGAINLAQNPPSRTVTLLAPTAELIVQEDFHPALVDVLLEAAERVRDRGGLLAPPGTFPSSVHVRGRVERRPPGPARAAVPADPT